MQPRIMYVEYKGDGLTGTAWIGRVTFSQTGRTIYYRGRTLLAVKDYKANHMDVESGARYWVSGCKKKGDDTLYPGIVAIDEDVREEYWRNIRSEPDRVHEKSFRSEGKYAKRRPR